MFEYLKSVRANFNELGETVVFWLGYILASITTAGITLVLAMVMQLGKFLNIEVCREAYTDLIEISRESFDRFLNHIQVILPDKVRRSLAWEMECW